MAALNAHVESVQLFLDLGAYVPEVIVEDETTIDLIERCGKVMRDFKGSADDFAVGGGVTGVSWLVFNGGRDDKYFSRMVIAEHFMATNIEWDSTGRKNAVEVCE